MRRASSTIIALLAAWALSACASPDATRVWLVVDSDLPRAEVDEIEIEVDGRAIGAERETRRVPLGPEAALPVTLPITLASGPLGPIEVRVRARGRLDVEQRATFDFVPGRELELAMDLSQRCEGVRCGGEQTCRGGTCAPRSVALRAAEARLLSRPTDAGSGGACHEAGCPNVAPGLGSP